MSVEKNVQIVKNFLAALGRRDKQGLLALSAQDIEWIIPGEDWPLAGTHRGHSQDGCRQSNSVNGEILPAFCLRRVRHGAISRGFLEIRRSESGKPPLMRRSPCCIVAT